SIDYSIKNNQYTSKKQISRYPALKSYISDIIVYDDSDKDLINIYDIINMYKHNEKFRKELEELIYNANDPHLREKFITLHKQLFINNSSNDVFNGFKTYSDYLKFKEPDLYYYTIVESEIYNEDTFDRENIFRERIFELVSSIDNHLNLKEQYFTNSNFVGIVNFIRDYITILIMLFKLEDKFENSINIIDEDNVKYSRTTKKVDKINTLDKKNIIDKINRKESIETKDELKISIIKKGD